MFVIKIKMHPGCHASDIYSIVEDPRVLTMKPHIVKEVVKKRVSQLLDSNTTTAVVDLYTDNNLIAAIPVVAECYNRGIYLSLYLVDKETGLVSSHSVLAPAGGIETDGMGAVSYPQTYAFN